MSFNQGMDFQALQPKRLRKPGVTILNEILKIIKLDQALVEENNLILQVFLSTFLDEMKKKDELFREVFQKVHYTGSYYSDLRISEPNEFDINIILKMPFKPSDFVIEYCHQVPSYAKYRLKNEALLSASHPRLLKNFFENGFLVHEKVRRWMQAVVDKALLTYTLPRNVLRINRGASGPARTLQLQKRRGIIDIDLVPVISCCLETKQPGIDHRVYVKLDPSLESSPPPLPSYYHRCHQQRPRIHPAMNDLSLSDCKQAMSTFHQQRPRTLPSTTSYFSPPDPKYWRWQHYHRRHQVQRPIQEFSAVVQQQVSHPTCERTDPTDYDNAFLVPKPYSHPPGKQSPVNAAEIQRLWRTHFPVAENKLIHNYGCVKPVIKLLKLLRDKEDWKILASYYLKTVVMWMIVENSNRENWREDKIDERLIEALRKLQGYVKDEKLPYFFSKKYNLISKINPSQAFNIYNRLTVIIRDAVNDPNNFWKIFKIEPTFSMLKL